MRPEGDHARFLPSIHGAFLKAPARPQTAANHDRRLFSCDRSGGGLPAADHASLAQPPPNGHNPGAGSCLPPSPWRGSSGPGSLWGGPCLGAPPQAEVWAADNGQGAGSECCSPSARLGPHLLPPLDIGGGSFSAAAAGRDAGGGTPLGSLARSASRLGTPALRLSGPVLPASPSFVSAESSSCSGGGGSGGSGGGGGGGGDELGTEIAWGREQAPQAGWEGSRAAAGQSFDQEPCCKEAPPQYSHEHEQQRQRKEQADVAAWRAELAAALAETAAADKVHEGGGGGAGLAVRLARVHALLDVAEGLGSLEKWLDGAPAAEDRAPTGGCEAAGPPPCVTLWSSTVAALLRLTEGSVTPDVLLKVCSLLLRLLPPGCAQARRAVALLHRLSESPANDARFRLGGAVRPLLCTLEALAAEAAAEGAAGAGREPGGSGSGGESGSGSDSGLGGGGALLRAAAAVRNISAGAANQRALARAGAVPRLGRVLAAAAAASAQDGDFAGTSAVQAAVQAAAALRNLALDPGHAGLFLQAGTAPPPSRGGRRAGGAAEVPAGRCGAEGSCLSALLAVAAAHPRRRDLSLAVARCLGKLASDEACLDALAAAEPRPGLRGPLLLMALARRHAACAATLSRLAYVLGAVTAHSEAARAALACSPEACGAVLALLGRASAALRPPAAAAAAPGEGAAGGGEGEAARTCASLLRLVANLSVDAASGRRLARAPDSPRALCAALAAASCDGGGGSCGELALAAVAAAGNLAFHEHAWASNEEAARLLDPRRLLTALEPLLTSGDDDAAAAAARALSNLLRASAALPRALAESREGAIVVAALLALLDHPSWRVVAAVAGALVNVAGTQGGRRALVQSGGAAMLAALQTRCRAALAAGRGGGGGAAGRACDDGEAAAAAAAAEMARRVVHNLQAGCDTAAP